MAYNGNNGLLSSYGQLKTIPAVVGLLFAMASVVLFADGTVSLGIFNYELTELHATFVSLGALVVAFMSSETNRFEYYETWEQILVAGALGSILAGQFLTEFNNLLEANQPLSGLVFTLLSVVAWGVLAR